MKSALRERLAPELLHHLWGHDPSKNRDASGFQMLDKANPGLVTSPRSEALPHDRKAVVVAGRFRH